MAKPARVPSITANRGQHPMANIQVPAELRDNESSTDAAAADQTETGAGSPAGGSSSTNGGAGRPHAVPAPTGDVSSLAESFKAEESTKRVVTYRFPAALVERLATLNRDLGARPGVKTSQTALVERALDEFLTKNGY